MADQSAIIIVDNVVIQETDFCTVLGLFPVFTSCASLISFCAVMILLELSFIPFAQFPVVSGNTAVHFGLF